MPSYLDAARSYAARATASARTIASGIRAALPFSGEPQPPANIPAINWNRVGPAPIPPGGAPFVSGFSDHTFAPAGAPLAFDGFTLDRLRAAASVHRQGIFLESSLAAVALMSFGPALAAWEQRCAPAISLERRISAEGARGIARVCAEEVGAMLCPREGLLPSECFPPENFGAIESNLALFRFGVLQHVDGEEDPDTGVRLRYTRPWPVWSVNYYRELQKWVAITREGLVEIDGTHFTLVSDIPEPHLYSPILALMEQAFSGRQTEQFRNAWIRAFGSPKLIGTMPPKVATESELGRAFFAAVQTILGPGGFGVLPYDGKMDTIGLKGEASGSFKEALDDVIAIIGMILVGSSGLLDKGTGGVYTSPVYEGVAMRLISRDIVARDRAINGGHVMPYLNLNYASEIADARRRGAWIDPVLKTPLPDLAAERRHENAAKQQKAYYDAMKAEIEISGFVTKERSIALAQRHGADPIETTGRGIITKEDMDQKLFAPDEFRARKGYDPLPNGSGSAERLAEERAQGRDKTGTSGPAEPTKSNGVTQNGAAT